MRLRKHVGQRLRAYRLRRHHTLEAVAADLSISTSALSAYELGDRPLTLDHLERFAAYYDVLPDELLRVNRDTVGNSVLQDN